MKCLFVNPPTEACFSSWYPPLGIAYLSGYLKTKLPEWKTACADISIGEAPLKRMKEEKPDLVAFTCTTIGYNNTVKLAAKIREVYPEVPFVLGGQHISALPHTLPPLFQACVVGEGENALVTICREFEATGKLSKRVYEVPRVENLDELPFPDREMFSLKDYYLKPQNHCIDMVGVGLSMMTSRGCRYRCVFCSSSRFFKAPIRGNSARYVADEMQFLKQCYGVEYLNVFDDLFQFSKERLRLLAREVHERRLDLKLIIQAHAPTFDEETARLLKAIGVVYCGFGFEASTPAMLKFLKNGVASVDDNRRAMRTAHKYGMKAGSGFLTGVPGQTVEDLAANDRFIQEEHLDASRKYILCPYPGTPLWDYAKQKGLVSDEMDYSKIYQMPNGKNVVLA
ncbi:MAG: B12-binding domain-containing radical SAM protein [Candidatus Bathyarchaeia archaeon]